MKKRIVSIILAVIMLASISNSNAFARDIEYLTEDQKISIAMLNYLNMFTEGLNTNSKSRMYLEESYDELINCLNPTIIDENTQGQLNNLFNTIKDFRMNEISRERVEYLYEQKQAKIIKAAVPNPVTILASVRSNNLTVAILTTIFMVFDSVASVADEKERLEQEYLEQVWALSDDEYAELCMSRENAFNYMLDTVQENDIKEKYVLSEKQIQNFVKHCKNDNVTSLIVFLEDHESEFGYLRDYWFELAKAYAKNGDNRKCYESVVKYQEIKVDLFKKDKDYANVLMLAINAAKECLENDEYYDFATDSLRQIIRNTDDDDWEIRYFASIEYIELYKKTYDRNYLEEAYRITKNVVNELVSKQLQYNKKYLSETVKEEIPKGISAAEKKEYEDYNKMVEEKRKTQLPPIYEPLKLSCDLLFEIGNTLGIDNSEKEVINRILHHNDEPLFLIPEIDRNYWLDKKTPDTDPETIEVSYEKSGICIPAKYLSDDFSVTVSASNDEKTEEFTDWKVIEVKRGNNDLDSYVARLYSENIKDFWYKDGSKVIVTIDPAQDDNVKEMEFVFSVKKNSFLFIPLKTEFIRE